MNMTPQQIFDYRNSWLPGYDVVIHSDIGSQASDWCKANLRKEQWQLIKWVDVYAHSMRFETKEVADQFREGMNSEFILS